MRDTTRIKDMSKELRPYEKFERYGPESLSEAELLAIIIRTGTRNVHSVKLADQVLHNIDGYEGLTGLTRMTTNQLMSIDGIGKVKAIQIKCVCELSKRIARASYADGVVFNNPKIIADYYMEELRHRDKEVLMALFLNTKHMLIKSLELSKGTINSSLMSAREIFVEALKYNAVYVVLLHNHPSGDPTPSREDIVNTRKVYDAGKLIGIELIDHVIIGDNKYISLNERGVIR